LSSCSFSGVYVFGLRAERVQLGAVADQHVEDGPPVEVVAQQTDELHEVESAELSLDPVVPFSCFSLKTFLRPVMNCSRVTQEEETKLKPLR